MAPGGFPGGPGGVVSQGQSTQMEDPFVAEWLKKVSKHRPGNSAGQHMKVSTISLHWWVSSHFA